MTIGDLASLADRLASLPDQLDPEHEDSKRFDVLLLNAQLSVLRGEPFERKRRKIIQIAGLLEDQQTIPVVAAQLALIMDIQTDEWWVDVSYPMLDEVRKKLRALVPLIERGKKGVVYSDCSDVIGPGSMVELPGTGGGDSSYEFAQFRKKAQQLLQQHLEEPVVAKVRGGQPLSDSDIAALQGVLVSAGIGDDDAFATAIERSGSFGRFVLADAVVAVAAFRDRMYHGQHRPS